jgi:hypothetical protein
LLDLTVKFLYKKTRKPAKAMTKFIYTPARTTNAEKKFNAAADPLPKRIYQRPEINWTIAEKLPPCYISLKIKQILGT